MNPHHGRAVARPQVPVMPVILRGGAWTARRIANNCLRQHCHALAAAFRPAGMAPLKALCGRVLVVLETRSRVLRDLHPNELAVIAAVARLGAYSDQWLCAPEDWWPEPEADARAQWASLLRHLLALYPVPASLDAVWETRGALIHFERDCWCALAYGRTLRQVTGLPKSVSARVLHSALTVHHRQSFASSIWAAQLHALGASALLGAAVLGSRVLLELGDHALWVRLAAKFAAGTDEQAQHFAFVADALVTARAHHDADRVEQLLRLTLAQLIRHCQRFVGDLLRANGHLWTDDQLHAVAARAELNRLAAARWQPLLGGEPFLSRCGRSPWHAPWRVEELCSIDSLKLEGRAMNHCVGRWAGRYAHRCRNGTSAIFSVRHHAQDREGNVKVTSWATIEVHPRKKRVVQIRSLRNRPVNHNVMILVHEWAAAHGLEGVA